MEKDLYTTPKLGFGLMRLPEKDGEIDLELTKQMVDAFMAQGYTYFDTAYVYIGGNSERYFKKAVVDRYPRDAYTIATKLPGWELKAHEDMDRMFSEQLERLGVDYIDFYLLHSIEVKNAQKYDEFDSWSWIREKKAKGLVKHIGFSFHDTPELLDEVLTKYPEFEFVQLQINYLDWEDSMIQSRRCYEVARKHNKAIAIMEPVKGGTLASMSSEISKLLTDLRPNDSLASWGIRFAASLDGVMTVLSGMTSLEQVEDNMKTMGHFEPITEAEQKTIDQVVKMLRDVPAIACTSCRYCVDGCPQQIKIPDIFRCLNHTRVYGKTYRAGEMYSNAIYGAPASSCIGCGQCEAVCPQHLEITTYLKEAAQVFDTVE